MVLFVWSDWSFLTLYDVKLSKYSYVFEIALIMKIMDFIILKTLFSWVLLYFCPKMLLIWWRRESCLFQKDCSTIELPQAEIQDFQTQHSGGMMALAPLLLPLLKKVGLLPELPPSFQAISRQNALTHTHTHKIANFLNVITHHSLFYLKKSYLVGTT